MSEENTTPEVEESSSETSENTEVEQNAEVEENAEAEENSEESSEESEDASEEAASEEEPAEEAEAPKEEPKRTWKMKVMGEEREFDEKTLLDNMDDILKFAQMGESANKKFEEAANLRKESETLVQMLKDDPAAVLSNPNIGVDLKKFAQDILNQEIENMKKTPEQKEKETLQQQLEDARKALKDAEEQKQSNELKQMEDEAARDLENNMLSAIEAGGLPKNPYVVRRMADYMLLAMKQGVDLSPDDVFPLVKSELQKDLKDLIGASPDDVFEDLVGKDRISNYRKKSIKKMKKPIETTNNIKDTGTKKENEEDKKKKYTMNDLLRGSF
jgi:hypothetical protein